MTRTIRALKDRPVFDRLVFVTFSGAHGTGKTTLLQEARAALLKRGHCVSVAESCSSRLFERIQRGEVKTPNGAVPAGYDDIDRLGLRAFFQQTLPDALSFEVERAVIAATQSPAPTAYVLVDRWFPDIYTYTEIESPNLALHQDVMARCRVRYFDLRTWAQRFVRTVDIVSFYVTLASSTFPVTNQKFRATCSPVVFETLCLRSWPSVLPGQRPTFINRTSLDQRMIEVMANLNLNPSPPSRSRSTRG